MLKIKLKIYDDAIFYAVELLKAKAVEILLRQVNSYFNIR